ncbi:transglycosylase SLT domain-containing protein [Nocardia pseudobrasiliensis]|uniref:Transglycosylase-like protein with SLT domain n=1 Tax=Nocardia pseudobrasiliensis TaxID=45979 RepID=A0A370I4Y4_9NOCA|nr:transglycosylase SLT domain-containing protein [Nocardia pseudobrasiliensis]RDI65765.1 transglycosylase-like protein with SLT domain [Nocardia pseudobrasiliensis]
MSYIAGHIKITVSPDMSGFTEAVEREFRKTRSDSAADNARDDKAAVERGRARGKAEGVAHGKAFQDASDQHTRPGRGRGMNERLADYEKELRERRKIRRKIEDDDEPVRQRSRAAKKDADWLDDEIRKEESARLRRNRTRQARQEREAENDAKRAAQHAEKLARNSDLTARTARERQQIADALNPAGRNARGRLRGYTRHVQEQILSAGQLTQFSNKQADAWRKAAAAQDRASADYAKAVQASRKADRDVDNAIDDLAQQRATNASRRQVGRAENRLDNALDNQRLANDRKAVAKDAVTRARAEADRAGSEFRSAHALSSYDQTRLDAIVRNVTAQARQRRDFNSGTADSDSNVIGIANRNADLLKRRGANRNDQNAAQTAIAAAAELDSAERKVSQAEIERTRAQERLTRAAVAKHQADAQSITDATRLAAINNELTNAMRARDIAEARVSTTKHYRDVAATRYQGADRSLRDRENVSPVLRAMERVGSGLESRWGALNDKLIYMGRYLSSVGQIAMSSAAALAAFGAVNLLPLISSLGQALAALSSLPAVIVAAGTGIAAIAVGGHGLFSTLKAAGQASKSATADAESAAEKQTDADRRVRESGENLATARRDAARTAASGVRQIVDAEKSVQSAQRTSEDAQKSLTRARKDAAEKIKDLNDALKGNALSERGAKLSALRAEKNLWKVSADPDSDWLDIAEAVQARDEANYNVEQVQAANQKKLEAATEANAKGVEGDDQVVEAKQALIDANSRLAEAQERVGEVVQQVADANDDANRRAERAVESYNDALREQQKVLDTLGKSGAAKTFAEEYRKLSPHARDLVDQVRSLGPEWTKLRTTAQDALTRGLGQAFTDVATKQLPLMRIGFAAINNEINAGLKQSLAVFGSNKAQLDYSAFLGNTTSGFRNLMQAAAPLSRIFIDLSTAGSAVLPRLGQALSDSASRWADRIAGARETGELNAAIDRGIEKMKQFGHVIGNTFGGLRGFFQALRGEGDGLLATLDHSTARFEAWTKSAEGASSIQRVFAAINEKAGQVWSIIKSIVSSVASIVAPVADNFGFTLTVAEKLASAIAKIVDALMSFGPTAKLIEGVLTVFAAMYTLRSLSTVFTGIKSAAMTAYTGIGVAAINARQNMTGYFTGIREESRSTYQLMRGHQADHVEDARGRYSQLQSRAGAAFSGIQTAATSALGGVRSMTSSLVSAMGGWFNVVAIAGVLAFTQISSAISGFNDKVAAAKKDMQEAQQFDLKFKLDLSKALNNSDGLVDEQVKGVMLQKVEQYQKTLDSAISKKTSFADQYGEQWKDTDWWNVGEHLINLIGGDMAIGGLLGGTGGAAPDSYKLDQAADAAKAVKDRLSDLKITNEGLTSALTGSNIEWDRFKVRLLDGSEGGRIAAEQLQRTRDEFVESQKTASRLRDTIDELKSKNLEAADAVEKLTSVLARQRKNNMTQDDAKSQAFSALDELNNFKPVENGGTVFEGDQINLRSENGRRYRALLLSVAGGYDQLASASYQASLSVNNNEGAAAVAAQNATQVITDSVRERIAAYVGEGQALENLITQYQLGPNSLQQRIDAARGGNQAVATAVDPTVPASVANNPTLAALFPALVPGVPQNTQPGGLSSLFPSLPATQPNQVAPQPAPQSAVQQPNPAPQVVPVQLKVPDYSGSLQAYNDYVAAVEAGYNQKLLPAFTGSIDKANALGTAVSGAADTAKPAFELITGYVNGLNIVFGDNLGDQNGALKAWKTLYNTMGIDITAMSDTMFPKLVQALTDLGNQFNTTQSGIATSFGGIKRGVAEPINWLIQNVFNGGLKNAWNAVRQVIPSLPEWTVTVEPITGYYSGGVIPGYTPGRDTQVIAVGGGEAILRPEVVRAIGTDWVHGVNSAARTGGVDKVQQQLGGRFAGAFADGGIVDTMKSAIQERFPGMQLTSGYRNEPGSYHSTGQAGDFSDGTDDTPGMQRLAAWIASNFLGSTMELIHQPFNHNIKNRAYVGDGNSVYGPATMAEHRNHVHWALAQALGSAAGTTIPNEAWDGLSAAIGQVQQLLWQPMSQLTASMPDWGSAGMAQIPSKMLSTVMSAVSEMVGKSSDVGLTPFDISAGAAQWRPNVIAALEREGWAADERNIRLTLAQIQSESAGNPNITQQVQDVNSGGNEAIGLLQVTPGTFAAHRNPALPNDRTNPDANISAALRYYRSRYGNDLGAQWGQGHGYDQGGWLPHGGWGWNLSGKAEPVFTNEQWQLMTAQLSELASAVPGLGKMTVPTGPAEFVDNLRKVVAAAGKAIADLVQARDAATAKLNQKGSTPQTSPDASGGGTQAKVDPNTVDQAKDGLATGELNTDAVPTGNRDGDITPTNPDPESAATGLAQGSPATGTDQSDNSGTLGNPTPASPGDPAGATQPQKNTQDAADEAYRTAAMTTRDPQHYQQIWDTAGKSFLKSTWNQFTSDLGITGNGFLSQIVSAGQSSDNQLNQVITHELNKNDTVKAVQKAIADAPRVVEEHIHYHVTNIEEALRKNAIRQRQNAAAFIAR